MCFINGHLSSSCSLSCGVPQGTILGLLLFLLYGNDLPNCLSNCEPRMYTDDTHLTYAGNNIHKDKFKRRLRKCFRVTQVATAKSLGVTIDDNLDWGSHMEKIIKKVSSGIGAIKRVKHLVPQATLQPIYQALMHPHFNYCNTVWGNCGITLSNKLQKLQNRAVSVLTFSECDEDAGYLF